MTNDNSMKDITLSTQEDPIIMYLIVRESLNMSIGKTAAQCAHAAQILLQRYYCDYFAEIDDKHELFRNWLNSSFRKVVLGASESAWSKIKNELSPTDIAIVVDIGLTELSPNTETVIGVSPMYKSQVPKLIKRLQTLK